MTIKGQVADASFSTRRAGFFLNFQRRIFFSPNGRANLLSLSKVQEEWPTCFVTDASGSHFKVDLLNGTSLIFKNLHNRIEKIYGPSVPTLKDKMTSKITPVHRDLEFFQPVLPKEQTLHSDVGHVNSHSFLISVARPLDLTISTKVKSLKATDIKAAFKKSTCLKTSK